jgi:ADP-ribose pyrophosphatase YjhB (NUDIX family)
MDIHNKASCVVIINNDKKVLLIKKNNRYDIPGGKLKYNETYEKAAVREIKEETGLDISRLKLIFSDTVTNCHIKISIVNLLSSITHN